MRIHDAVVFVIAMIPVVAAAQVPLGLLLRQALQKSDYQIVGLPRWTDTERYSIRTMAPESIPPTANTTMLLNLLKDRFQLVTHPETRELPIFNLVMARADGRLGPDLKATPRRAGFSVWVAVSPPAAVAPSQTSPPTWRTS